MSDAHSRKAISLWLEQTPREMLTIGGRKLEVARRGQGPAVLALHGAMGGFDQGLMLARCALAETSDFQVLAPSRPGYLGTPLASGPSPAEQADLYAGLLGHLGIEGAIVLAISGGGPSAVAFANRYPGLCRALILVSACTAELRIPEAYLARVDRMVRLVQLAPVRWLMQGMGRYLPGIGIRRSIEDKAAFREALADKEVAALLRAFQASTTDHLKQRMPGTLNDMEVCAHLPNACRLETPVRQLVIHGTADRVVPFSQSEQFAANQPGAELMEIERGEHVSLFTHVHAIRSRISALLEALGSRSGSEAEGVHDAPGHQRLPEEIQSPYGQ